MRRFRLYVLKHYLRASRRLRWQHPFSPNLDNAHIPGRTASLACLFLPLYVQTTAQLDHSSHLVSGHPSTLAIEPGVYAQVGLQPQDPRSALPQSTLHSAGVMRFFQSAIAGLLVAFVTSAATIPHRPVVSGRKCRGQLCITADLVARHLEICEPDR
jgi:hypothetical protein